MGKVRYAPIDSHPGLEFELSYSAEDVDRIHHINVIFTSVRRYNVEYDLAADNVSAKRAEYEKIAQTFVIDADYESGSGQVQEELNAPGWMASPDTLEPLFGGKRLDRLVKALIETHKKLVSGDLGSDGKAATTFSAIGRKLRAWQKEYKRLGFDPDNDRLADAALELAHATAIYLENPSASTYAAYKGAVRRLNRVLKR